MKFDLTNTLTLLALVTGTLSAPEPVPDVQADKAAAMKEAGLGFTPRDAPDSLVKRACDYGTGCRSVGSGSTWWTGAGKYCGFCFQVDAEHTFVNSHLYQLNSGTGSRSCCDYGVATSCRNEWAANPQ
ncbi:hypothetical protein DL95DRAFT_462566 [Leptodontidium sp. 2 PMI_412]|nr:hypothetical protein DL95DRAFT_462566 [Leptodontidium sp. 2 PMI_412]